MTKPEEAIIGLVNYMERKLFMSDEVSARIKARRKQLRMTLQEVADLIGTSKAYMWELENKKASNLSADKAYELTKALDTTIEYLLGKDIETDGDMLNRLGMNGELWAKEMHKRFPTVPEDDLLSWCCNMIMAGHDRGVR